ncbi:hypothetical protein [Heliophilum fasciatum]|uniref:Uncharacterized protein n=1 Tax=Heliophilum fasciatum TaxID=35700 RepID=A0A4R2RU76_9FIRM|nr:hypothetical protein [Heliophilum fasciatum]MCW2278516.1 hypothetical protein [Heliophilum fasciatum]TCP63471.1 hypothetical protein EDD73_11814 [Heliophilum fasciatum]
MFGGIRWLPVLLFTVVALGGLGAGQVVYDRYWVEAPYAQAIASVLPEAAIQVHKESDHTRIELQGPPIEDLGASYPVIYQASQERFGPNVQISWPPTDDPLLQSLWDQLQFLIYQGIETGNYTVMKESSDQLIQGYSGVTGKVAMDRDFVYVQLVHGDDCLYQVIPREKRGETR